MEMCPCEVAGTVGMKLQVFRGLFSFSTTVSREHAGRTVGFLFPLGVEL